MNLLNKRIVVTGGKGFLGAHIIRKLEQRGAVISLLLISRNSI